MKQNAVDLVALIVGVLMLSLWFLGVGMAVGSKITAHEFITEAIEAGVGRWVIDAKTGEKSFKWGKE